MLQINSVRTLRGTVEFSGGEFLENRVHVITGPNGSGKTDLLTSLAINYRYGPQDSTHVWATKQPERVIAQTFSPFSRFPSAPRNKYTIADTYTDERLSQEIYEPVGFHKSLRHVGGSFSRHVLEQAIFRLTENVLRAYTLGEVLDFLGFKRQIRLEYRAKPALHNVLQANALGDLSSILEQPKIGGPDTRRLAKEVQRDSTRRVSDLLESAIEILGDKTLKSRISQEISFYQPRPESYAKLQALAVLRRFELLRLEECTLFHPDHGEIDLSYASSGQQQLLCSLFGMASALKSDSLVLIDEPELSLHPRWQMEFLEHMAGLLRAVRGCHVLIATHSPLIVQRAQKHDLGIIEMGERIDGKTTPNAAGEQASSVEETLIDVFDAPIPNSLYLGNELIRIINSSHEQGPKFSTQAKSRLTELAEVYANSEELGLIHKASVVVNMDGDA